MLELPQVTLCCVDTQNHALAIRAMQRSCASVRFARAIFFTDSATAPDLELRPSGPIRSHADYSQFVAKELFNHVETDFALVIQWDGYVVQPEAWEPAFLDFDYIGAPWPDGVVGNGGFSLRSRRLLAALQDDSLAIGISEDVDICRTHRQYLADEYGIRFADKGAAERFSFEMEQSRALSGKLSFGFHGVFNLPLIESDDEIVNVVSMMTDATRSSEMTRLLGLNCRALGKHRAADLLTTNSEKQ